MVRLDEWVVIDEFPNYVINADGFIKNLKTDRFLVLTRNQYGVIQVGLMKGGEQYKRGVALLVARAFLDPPPSPAFNTPINLDGDRSNCSIENLVWRPRWFAIKYHQQFKLGPQGFSKPIMDIKTKEQFPDSWAAATKYGLLDREILIATLNRTYVWPTYQEFRVM
jgi:hypothetical protein